MSRIRTHNNHAKRTLYPVSKKEGAPRRPVAFVDVDFSTIEKVVIETIAGKALIHDELLTRITRGEA